MRQKINKLYLSWAGYRLQINFHFSEQVVIEGELFGQIRKFWKDFLVEAGAKPDFTLNFLPHKARQKHVLVRDKTKYFFLGHEKNFGKMRINVYYSLGLSEFNFLLKEILCYLIDKDGGIMLHASACLNTKTGFLYAFLAPSGGGKTTAAKMLSGGDYVKFNDDLLLVRRQSSGWQFYSPPIIEKELLPKNRTSTKIKIFLVRKARVAKVEKLKSEQVPKMFLPQIWSESGIISAKTLFSSLRFIKDNNFYLLDATLEAKKMRKVIDEA